MWNWICTGPSWNKQKLIVSIWRDVAKAWQRKIGDYRKKFKNSEPSNYHHSFTCKWPLPLPSLCVLHVSVLGPHLPPHRRSRSRHPSILGPTQWFLPSHGPFPSTPGPPLPSHICRSMRYTLDREFVNGQESKRRFSTVGIGFLTIFIFIRKFLVDFVRECERRIVIACNIFGCVYEVYRYGCWSRDLVGLDVFCFILTHFIWLIIDY